MSRSTVTTTLFFDVECDPDLSSQTLGHVAINGHPLWSAMYPPGTTHEQVMEDVVDRLSQALYGVVLPGGYVEPRRQCLWCSRWLPFVDRRDALVSRVECQCGVAYHVSFIRDCDERLWQQVLDRDGYSVRRVPADSSTLTVERDTS